MAATHTDNVAKLYTTIGVHEQTRLPTHPMEREITLLTIKKYLPPAAKIADIGGGPGVLSFALADQGHAVDLRDLTPELIRLAQETQNERKTNGKPVLQSLGVNNALEKSGLEEGSYDGVLLLGPLYHLLQEDERVTAVKNALELLKEGGVLFVAFITIAAHLRDVAMRDSSRIVQNNGFYTQYVSTCQLARGTLEQRKLTSIGS